MNKYGNTELTDMVLTYGEASGNARKAHRIYSARFPNRHIPHHSMFVRVVQRLRETGSFQKVNMDRGWVPANVRASSSSSDEDVKVNKQKIQKKHRTYLEIPNIEKFYEVLKK